MKYFSISVLSILLVGSLYPIPGVYAQQHHSRAYEEYIVVLKDGVGSPDEISSDIARTYDMERHEVYSHALRGFTAFGNDETLDRLAHDDRVAFVTEDRMISLEEYTRASRVKPTYVTRTQTVPTGVSRIGAQQATHTGAGIGVAVIDTGVDLSHPDLKPHIVANTSCVPRVKNGNDDNGHGTHVAGTIAAIKKNSGVIGVAPDVNIIAVKVLDRNGSGTWSSVICGIDWVTAHAKQYNIKVANMSLAGAGESDNNCGNTNNDALHKALCRSRDAGVTYVVAAGNSNVDASSSVPAAYTDSVITVSALADSNGVSGGTGSSTVYGADDTFASFSSYGTPVELGAPGVNILSTYKGGGYATLSGTSMATPHVSGSAALYLQTHSAATWDAVRDVLVSLGELAENGHTDPSGLHPEPVVRAAGL